MICLKFCLLLCALMLVSHSLLALEYHVINYTVAEKKTLSLIYDEFLKTPVDLEKSEMAKKTIAMNPEVTSWSDLVKETRFKIYLDVKEIDEGKMALYREKIKKEEEAYQKLLLAKRKRYNSSIYYIPIFGKFHQSNPNYMTINFNQYSFLSMGGSFVYLPKEKDYRLSSDLYFSKIGVSGNNLNSESIDIDPEINFNFYYFHKYPKKDFYLLGGVDFERFSTFNLKAIQMEQSFDMNNNKVVYLTIGFDKTFMAFKRPLYFKTSFSKSFISSVETKNSLYSQGAAYSGYKVLAYLDQRIVNNYFWHAFYKYHSMSGPDQLTVHRLGIGIGYIF